MKNRAAWQRTAVGRLASVPDAGMAPRVGRLKHGAPGELLVECGDSGAIPARLVAGLDRSALLDPGNRDREVLLVFDQGDPGRPIILDLLERPAEEAAGTDVPARAAAAARTSPEALVDGRRLVIEAEREIVLRCGKGSITIQADGTVTVRGTRLLSRSSGINKIKGATVLIN